MQKLAIGIDLGGTQLRVALVDQAGSIVARAAERTDSEGGPSAVFAQIDALLDKISTGIGRSRYIGVGVSSPGPLDTTTGVVLDIPTLPGWNNIPLKDMLAKKLRLPTVVENDGISAAIGEWRFGAGKGLQNIAYLTISTGIGGGVIADGRVVRGRRGFAGHLGHIIIDYHSDAVCSCGAKGCFEALGAGSALTRRARVIASTPAGATLRSIAAGDLVDAGHVSAAARGGDPAALALLDEEAAILGIGFTGILHAFSPDIVVVGGGVSNSFDLMELRISATVRRNAMKDFRDVPIRPAQLGENAGLIGAASLIFEPC
ncbi:ROK family protein [Devosia sp. UYZn731]|uniref:ROK family protein n=1 Tax=Devosia sp. UYZn731 TaxID=3156345 RepID=UPI003393E8AC